MIFRNNISPLTKTKSESLLKRIALLCFVFLMLSAENLNAQVISNNGAVITIPSGVVISNASDVNNTSGTIANDGTIELTGNWTNGGTFTSSTGTVNYNNATGGQTVTALNYNNLTISNSTGITTLNGSIGIKGTFSPSAGALTSAGTSTVNFNNSTGGQSIAAFNYYNLTISNTSNVNTLVGSVGVSNVFTPSAGALTAAGTSTVNYNGSSAQSVVGFSYNNLTLSGAADTSVANTKTALATLTITGALTINSGNSLDMSAFSSSTFGVSSVNNGKIKWTTSNVYVAGTGTTEFYGSSASTVAPGSNYGNILFTGAGTMTISGAVTATGGTALTGVTVGNNLTVSGTGNLTITGMDLNNDGIITNNGTITVQ